MLPSPSSAKPRVNMFSHITVGCSDLEAAVRFRDAVLYPLGPVRRVVRPIAALKATP